MNIFRIPLNAFVVLLLLKIKYLSPQIVFSVCTGAHAVAFLCYYYFYININVKQVRCTAPPPPPRHCAPTLSLACPPHTRSVPPQTMSATDLELLEGAAKEGSSGLKDDRA